MITNVAVSQTAGQITWTAAASMGVQSASITMDGNALSNITGPLDTANGVNYAATYGTLGAGAHTYVITVTDKDGATAQYTGTLTVGPVISQVAVSTGQGQISWNVADGGVTISNTAVTIDGAIESNQYGPVPTPGGANYVATFSALASGYHSYVITATDVAGNAIQYTGTFTVS